MSHALGARHGVPHGTANGILLPHVMRFNTEAAGAKLAQVARALGCDGQNEEVALALAGADAVAKLLAGTGHPTRLSEVGAKAGDLAACAELALTDAATATNPRAVGSADEVVAVYRQAM
jgi:lactaldehyde reductase